MPASPITAWPDWITTEGADGYEYVREGLDPNAVLDEIIGYHTDITVAVVGRVAWTRDLAEIERTDGESGCYMVSPFWPHHLEHPVPPTPAYEVHEDVQVYQRVAFIGPLAFPELTVDPPLGTLPPSEGDGQ